MCLTKFDISGSKRNQSNFKEHVELNKNENALCQNLWDVANTVFRGKFMPLNYYIKKVLKSVI